MIDTRYAPYGAFVLRASLGLMWIAHGLLKVLVFTAAGFAQFVGSQGFPTFLAWPIMLAEILGGLAILLGLYGRQVSVILLPILIGAVLVHLPNGWMFSAPKGGWEYPAFLIAASIAHIAIGDGALALRARALPFLGAPARA